MESLGESKEAFSEEEEKRHLNSKRFGDKSIIRLIMSYASASRDRPLGFGKTALGNVVAGSHSYLQTRPSQHSLLSGAILLRFALMPENAPSPDFGQEHIHNTEYN